MSENPIPHGEHHEPCTLRRSCKSAFLLPKEDIQGLIVCQGCSPTIRGKQTSSSKRVHVHKSMANRKNSPNQYPNPELKCHKKPQPSPEQGINGFWALLQCSSCSLSFLFNKSCFVYQPCLTSQSAASQASFLAYEGKNPRHQPTPACNTINLLLYDHSIKPELGLAPFYR
jgi:hypothetical protein